MSNLLFANDAVSTVASPINSAVLSVTVASATSFPVPGANEYFVATFLDAATNLIKEIVHVTAVVGNVLSIVRAQEGTTAKSWNTGDVLSNFWTAGSCQAMLQQSQQQSQAANYAVDTGAVNAMVITLSPAPTALSAILGTPIRVKVNLSNTSTSITLNPNGLGATTVRLPDGTLPGVGFLINGSTWEFLWNGFFFQINSQVSPATVGQVQGGTDNVHQITALALRGAMANTISGGLVSANYQKLPTGLIIQWGNFVVTGIATDQITLATSFPSHMQASIANAVPSGANVYACSCGPNTSPPVTSIAIDTFVLQLGSWVRAGGANVSYICFGY